MSRSYDDAEGMLQDQGLEVVVIPYRPVPPSSSSSYVRDVRAGRQRQRSRTPTLPRTGGNDMSKDGACGGRRRSSDGACDRIDASYGSSTVSSPKQQQLQQQRQQHNTSPRPEDMPDDSHHKNHQYNSPPAYGTTPKSPMQLIYTPRSQLAMVEAVCHSDVDVTTSTATTDGNATLACVSEEEDNKNGSNCLLPREKAIANRQPVPPPPPSQNPPLDGNSGALDKPNHRSYNAPPSKGTIQTATMRSTTVPKKQQPRRQLANKQQTHHFRSKSSSHATEKKRSTTPSSTASHSNNIPPEKMGYLQLAKLGYQELIHAIIRPPRSTYALETLGPERFVFCGEQFERRDWGLVNERGMRIECSLWRRTSDGEEDDFDVGLESSFNDCEDYDDIVVEEGMTLDGEDADFAGKVILDDWDENMERGKIFLHIPDRNADEEWSSSSSSYEGDEEERGDGDECREGEDGEKLGGEFAKTTHVQQRKQRSWGQRNKHRSFPPTSPPTKYSTNQTKKRSRRHPVVIYLHGNSSARVEVVPQLGHLLSLGVTVVAFDFSGSGMSDGEHVSLGYYEREDLQTVIQYLRSSGCVSTIGLWGRSMGAATALMYGSRDPTISCMILDSPFTDLTQLSEEMVEKGKQQGVSVPNFVVSVAMRMIKSSVKAQAGFSIRHISPISHADRCFIPAMFVAGEHDDFINKRHSILIHERYAGDKNISIVDGDHNSPRPRYMLQSACLFLQSCMQLPASMELVVPLGCNLLAPPWVFPGNSFGLAPSAFPGRSWIPVDSSKQQQKKASGATPSRNSPPEMPLKENRINESVNESSTQSATYRKKAKAYLAATAPPDMTERQKDIQSSLFKMLGQYE